MTTKNKATMKGTFLLVLIIVASAASTSVHGQGTMYEEGSVSLNNYDSGMGIYLYSWPRIAAPAGTYVEVLGGPTATSLAPLIDTTGQYAYFQLQTAEVDALGPGTGAFFDHGAALVPGVPSYGTAYFQVLAWLYAATYETATTRAASLVWSQRIGLAPGSVPPLPLVPKPLGIPAPIFLIPEPSTATLGGLALAILALRQWRKRPVSGSSK